MPPTRPSSPDMVAYSPKGPFKPVIPCSVFATTVPRYGWSLYDADRAETARCARHGGQRRSLKRRGNSCPDQQPRGLVTLNLNVVFSSSLRRFIQRLRIGDGAYTKGHSG